MLSERLTKAQVESQQLRAERDEMLNNLREIDATMRGRGRECHGLVDGVGLLGRMRCHRWVASLHVYLAIHQKLMWAFSMRYVCVSFVGDP